MGYYTEFQILITLKRETPKEVIDTIFDCIYGTEEIIDRIAPFSLKDIYKEKIKTVKPVLTHPLFRLERANGLRIFNHFNNHNPPYIQPAWRDWDQFSQDPVNYKPYWQVRIEGDLNYGWDAINQLVDYLGPHLAGHKPKQYVGWYKGEDQKERVNLYYKRNPCKVDQKRHIFWRCSHQVSNENGVR